MNNHKRAIFEILAQKPTECFSVEEFVRELNISPILVSSHLETMANLGEVKKAEELGKEPGYMISEIGIIEFYSFLEKDINRNSDKTKTPTLVENLLIGTEQLNFSEYFSAESIRGFQNDLTVIRYRFNRNEKNRQEGIITNEEYGVESNKIYKSVLSLLYEIESEEE